MQKKILKTEWVLGYYMHAKHTYIQSTSIRDFDKRRMINTTNKIEFAKTFDSQEDAENFLSTCITNEKPYVAQEYRHEVVAKEKQPQFSEAAKNAMV